VLDQMVALPCSLNYARRRRRLPDNGVVNITPETCMNRESNTEEIANSGLVPQLGMMVRGHCGRRPLRNTLFWLSGARCSSSFAVTAYGQIRLK